MYGSICSQPFRPREDALKAGLLVERLEAREVVALHRLREVRGEHERAQDLLRALELVWRHFAEARLAPRAGAMEGTRTKFAPRKVERAV